ncbi:hypothetical protein LR48_Vigan07g089500 [Vigna angularis]|uniref:Uncharacterized protein n=1 Tax=Phaseolus angularis TaxID=3914 RepID=A0A0L9UWT2_PHAAN|nr:hypothetical protein LR48_Vigan07g089500 [Vigna angularis]
MISLGGRSGSVGRRRKEFCTCGSEVSVGKIREIGVIKWKVRKIYIVLNKLIEFWVTLRGSESHQSDQNRCKIVSVNWYGAGRLLVRARRLQWRPGARLSGKVAPGAPHLAPDVSCSQKVAWSLFLIVFGVPGVRFGRFLSRFGGFGTFRDCW